MITAREIAYLALLKSLRNEGFISETLEVWRREYSPSQVDDRLAQELAYGCARMALALDYMAVQASEKKKLSLKLKEKALLRTAIYQICFLTKIPLYAVVDETVALAKKHCSGFFAKYLNALLRNVKLELPQGNNSDSLAIRYSYPEFFVEKMVTQFGLEKAKEIFEAGNHAGITMARFREKRTIEKPDFPLVTGSPLPIYRIEQIKEISQSPSYYIQNATPATLIGNMCKGLKKDPGVVLDLCASPGGKTLAVHDCFPEAKLFVNDVSQEKLKRMKENFEKYQVEAIVSCSAGEELKMDQPFDVIIIDAPCSNSGVLNKRPEARWRLNEETLNEITLLQERLLENAMRMLKPSGELWYLTCSILSDENEKLVQKFCLKNGFHIGHSETILPNKEGWDGGFAAVLKRG